MPAVNRGTHRQHQEGGQPPAHPPLPDTGRGLLVGALSLRLRQRLGLFQLTFLRCPFGLGPLAFLVQFRGVRRLALAEKCARLVEARAVPLGPRRVGRFALLPLPGVGQVGLAPQAGLTGPPELRRLDEPQIRGARLGLLVHPGPQPAPLANQALVGDIDDRVAFESDVVRRHEKGAARRAEHVDDRG